MGGGNRLAVCWDPKCGGPIVRLEGDIGHDCYDSEPRDDDGFCRDWQAFVLNLSPDDAGALAGWLTEAAAASRAFFAPTEGKR